MVAVPKKRRYLYSLLSTFIAWKSKYLTFIYALRTISPYPPAVFLTERETAALHLIGQDAWVMRSEFCN